MNASQNLEIARLAAIVDSSQDAIIGKDLLGIVTSWNGSAERIFGYTAEEMIGNPIVRLLPPDRIAEEDHILARLRAGERIDHFQTVRLTREGREIQVSLTISPICDENGNVVGASKIARDITRQKELEAERERLLARERELRREAERADQIKTEFLATLSHELRTPLMAIHGWSQILQTGEVTDDTVRKAAEVINRNVHLQARLIDELLDMNRILMGKIRLDFQPAGLCAVIAAAVEAVEPAAEAKQIGIHRTLDPRAGSVRGDPVRLQQIVWNLLSNAVKFTPAGGRVDISLERIGSHVEIAVADNGIGISADFLPEVFERFAQKESVTTRRYSGLGLGLAIVKHLVELHGGTVHAESAGEGAGATFRIRLPFLLAFDGQYAEKLSRTPLLLPPQWNAPDLSGRHILVVDDDKDAAGVIRLSLADCGAKAECVHSAAAALALLGKESFDLMIGDIGMPGMDGFQLIREVRALSEHARKMPAIALTAFGRAEDRRNAMISGFDVFLSKPIDLAELIATVARTLVRIA